MPDIEPFPIPEDGTPKITLRLGELTYSVEKEKGISGSSLMFTDLLWSAKEGDCEVEEVVSEWVQTFDATFRLWLQQYTEDLCANCGRFRDEHDPDYETYEDTCVGREGGHFAPMSEALDLSLINDDEMSEGEDAE